MDVILSRAGIAADQQRALCLGAVRDEVQQTEQKLADALDALRRVLDVVRVARDVDKSQTPLAALAPEVVAPVTNMRGAGKEIGQLLCKLHAGINGVELKQESESSTDEDERMGTDNAPAQVMKNERYNGAMPVAVPRPPMTFETASRAASSSSRSVQELTLGEYLAQQERKPSPPRAAENSFLKPRSYECVSDQWSQSESDLSEIEETDPWAKERKRYGGHHDGRRVASKTNGRASPASQPADRVTKKNAVVELEKRLALLPPGEMHNAFRQALMAAVQVGRLENVPSEEVCVQNAVDCTRTAIKFLMENCRALPDRGMERFEDIRQVLAAVVRAVQMSEGKLKADGLRDLLALTSKLQDQFPASAVRNRWARTALRNYITATYTKPAEECKADQAKLVSALAEVRGWKHRDDYSVARFEEIMAVVRVILEGSYDEWQPRDDPRLGELLGIMNVRVDAFGSSAIQQGRKRGVERSIAEMSMASFTLTLDLKSVPPREATQIYIKANAGFQVPEDVEAGFKRVAQMKSTNHFGLTTSALFTFMATAVRTRNQEVLTLEALRRFNGSVEALADCDHKLGPSEMLKANQELEKILYLMRVIMYKRPDYEECSRSTVDTVLSFFPESCSPTFVYPNATKSADLSAKTDTEPEDITMDEVQDENHHEQSVINSMLTLREG